MRGGFFSCESAPEFRRSAKLSHFRGGTLLQRSNTARSCRGSSLGVFTARLRTIDRGSPTRQEAESVLPAQERWRDRGGGRRGSPTARGSNIRSAAAPPRAA